MRFSFRHDIRGMATSQAAMLAAALAIASLIGVRLLEVPLRAGGPRLAERSSDFDRFAHTIPSSKTRVAGAGIASTSGIDFTATASSSAKRTLQSACPGGQRTVTLVAPAGGPPMLLSTCAASKSFKD